MSTVMKRRTLLGLPGLLPFLSLQRSRAAAATAPTGLVALSAADDVVAILGCSDAFDPYVAATLLAHQIDAPAFALLWSDREARQARLAKCRPQAETAGATGDDEVAAALMRTVHDALGAVLAPASPEGERYRDVALMRFIGDGSTTPPKLDRAQAMTMLTAVERRLFIRIHTIEPDSDDPAGWIDRLLAWRDERDAQLEGYADVLANPDANAWAKHVTGTPPLFSDKDPVLALARQARRGDRLSSREVRTALKARNASLYGRAVTAACAHLDASAQFIRGKLAPAAFTAALKRV